MKRESASCREGLTYDGNLKFDDATIDTSMEFNIRAITTGVDLSKIWGATKILGGARGGNDR